MPGVEAVRRLVDPPDVDVRGQALVDAVAQGVWRQVGVNLEVRDLRQRVHARVGAPRAVQLELPAPRRLVDGALDLPGNRPRVLLDLPAAIPRAGIFDHELEAGHWESEIW